MLISLAFHVNQVVLRRCRQQVQMEDIIKV